MIESIFHRNYYSIILKSNLFKVGKKSEKFYPIRTLFIFQSYPTICFYKLCKNFFVEVRPIFNF